MRKIFVLFCVLFLVTSVDAWVPPTDPVADIFDTISSSLTSSGINNNLGDVDMYNYTSFSGLYFEATEESVPLGRITFDSALDLSATSTQIFLQSLESLMTASVGSLSFDARTVEDIKNAGAEITLYNLPDGISDSTDALNRLVVRDDLGDIVPKDIITNPLYNVASSTFTFDTAHLTSFEVDTTPPEGEITNISPNQKLRGVVTVNASSSDSQSGVQKVEFWHNSADTLIGTSTSSPYSIGWDTTEVSDGWHNLYIKVFDNADNSQSTMPIGVSVDNTLPTVTELGDGLSDFEFGPGTTGLEFDEDIDDDSKSRVEDAISSGASGEVSFYWDEFTLIVSADENIIFMNDVFATVTDLTGNTSTDLLLIDSKNSYIQDLIDSAEVGDTVVVPSGTYQECLVLRQPINLVGENATSSIINISECNNGIEITSSNVSLKNLTLKNDTDNYGGRDRTYAIRVSTEGNISALSIDNVTMTDGKFYRGIYVSNASGEIKNSNIRNFCSGIYLNSASDLVISGNNISNNGRVDECAEESAIPRTGIDVMSSSNVVIRNNTIQNNDVGIYSDSNCDGEGCSSGVLVVKNKITDNDGYTASSWEYMSRDPYGIRNEGNNPVLASMNWWGSETGPNAEDNAGSGDNISSVVIYSPWYFDEEMTKLKGLVGEENEINISNEFAVSVNDIELSIPANTTITGSSGWVGKINAPTIIETLADNPSQSGFTTTLRTKIEVGFPSEKLILSKAAKLIFPGEAGKRVGYTRPGETFTEITTVCGENSQAWADANLGTEGDCKIDSGSDMVVWTKHFTQFATYTMTQNVSNGTNDNNQQPSTSSDSGVAGAGPSSIGFVRTYPITQPISAPLGDINDKKPIFTINMYLGLRHEQVKLLQEYLSGDKDIYPEGYITGFYGPLTVKSVKAFQKKYGISQVGRVGPITRNKLNEVFSGVTLSISQEEYLSIKDQIRILQEKINELMKLL